MKHSIRSMTGFGQGQRDVAGWRVTAEVRSVNHRYADVRLRLPTELNALEPDLRRRVLSSVRRGRVEVSVRTEAQADASRPTLQKEWVETALAAAEQLRKEHQVEGELRVADILRMPGALRVDAVSFEAQDDEIAAVQAAVDEALEAHETDRCREGAALVQDLTQRVTTMQQLAAEMAAQAKDLPPRLLEKLQRRIEQLTQENPLDPARLAQESALLVDRSDVTEELVRLSGHLKQAGELLSQPDGKPLGKRLDFLLQEIHRETNTINSKSPDLDLTRTALAMKAEAEKVREQIQNVE